MPCLIDSMINVEVSTVMSKAPDAYYHCHVTLDSYTTPPLGWKSTTIILENNKIQTDFMLTRHFRIGCKDVSSVDDILDLITKEVNWRPVMRIKLEKTSNFTLPVTRKNYIEVHVKVREGTQGFSELWVRSRNPSETNNDIRLFFFNKRVYEGGTAESVIFQINKELAGIDYMEAKFEQVVFDSNHHLDSWWA